MIRLLPLLLIAPLVAAAQGVVRVQLDPQQADAAFAGRKVAVVIGVGTYDDPLFTPLSYAPSDADAMAAALADPAIGGYDVVVKHTAREETTQRAIEQALRRTFDQVGPDDTLLVYLSGHGTLDLDWQSQPDLFLAASDTTKQDLPGTALRVVELQEALAGSRAGKKVLILDACHHGAGKSSVDPDTVALLRGLRGAASPLLREPERNYEAHLFASTFGLPALEDEQLGHGVYTWYLLQAMTEDRRLADRDGDGLVSVSEAHDHARDATIAHTGGVQVPRAAYRVVGREQIFLAGDEAARSDAERAMLYHFDDFYEGCSVEVDGTARGLLPRGVALEPGSHVVAVRTPSGELLGQRRVRVRAGQVLGVDEVIGRDPVWRFGAAAGVYVPTGPDGDLVGSVLGGGSFSIGTSFKRGKRVRPHLRFDLGWFGAQRDVATALLSEPSYRAHQHAVLPRLTFGPHIAHGRFGFVGGGTVGAQILVVDPLDGRPSNHYGAAAGAGFPSTARVEGGLLTEFSVSLNDSIALSASWTGTITPGYGSNSPDNPDVVLYSAVQGGVTFSR